MLTTKNRPRIIPGKTTLFLTDVATTFNIKPNTVRQHIRRGTFPTPTVRREPEIGWDAVDIYRWAYTTQRMPLDAIPFRYLRPLIADGTLPGPQAPRVLQVSCQTHGRPSHGLGISVQYGGLTSADLGFTLFYPDEFGRTNLDESRADIVVEVTGHVSNRGFYVDVHQSHPDYEYALDGEFHTQDVALLVQEPIPYWPLALRSSFGGVDRRTGHIIPVEGATAVPSRFLDGRSDALETFVSEGAETAHPELVEALRAEVADDYRRSAQWTLWHIREYVESHQAASWTLNDPDRHLFLAASPATLPDETAEEEFARTRLQDLLWEVPVGDTPAARHVAARFFTAPEQNMFSRAGETPAQRVFREKLEPVPAEVATLVHLAFPHPKYGRGPVADAVIRDYWQDPSSGALVTNFRATDDSRACILYAVPLHYPHPVSAITFDFDDEHQPFIWATNGRTLPFPRHPNSGYALGYDGSGPRAIKDTSAGLLGLDKNTPASPRWPFYREGYPTQVAAEEMASFYDTERHD